MHTFLHKHPLLSAVLQVKRFSYENFSRIGFTIPPFKMQLLLFSSIILILPWKCDSFPEILHNTIQQVTDLIRESYIIVNRDNLVTERSNTRQ